MLWNAALALFSFCGAVRLVPHVINLVAREGFKYTITANGRDWAGGGAFAFWLQVSALCSVFLSRYKASSAALAHFLLVSLQRSPPSAVDVTACSLFVRPPYARLQMFVFSKVPELGDTVFIILRKRPLIFLHWYHHVTVLLYTWHR